MVFVCNEDLLFYLQFNTTFPLKIKRQIKRWEYVVVLQMELYACGNSLELTVNTLQLCMLIKLIVLTSLMINFLFSPYLHTHLLLYLPLRHVIYACFHAIRYIYKNIIRITHIHFTFQLNNYLCYNLSSWRGKHSVSCSCSSFS